jgi:hypothetical protein
MSDENNRKANPTPRVLHIKPGSVPNGAPHFDPILLTVEHINLHLRRDDVLSKYLKRTIVVYVVFSMIISLTNIGSVDFVISFSELFKQLVPSLINSSEIASDKNNTIFILAISWFAGFAIIFTTAIIIIKSYIYYLIKLNSIEVIAINVNKTTILNLCFIAFFALVLLYGYFLPIDIHANGGFGKLIVWLLKSGTITSSILGIFNMVLCLMLSIGFVIFFSQLIGSKAKPL